jgi:hypothetical protein
MQNSERTEESPERSSEFRGKRRKVDSKDKKLQSEIN